MTFPTGALELIAKHEGFSPVPYQDSLGHTTILYGHNLDAAPLTDAAQAALDAGNPQLAGVLQLQADTQSALEYVSTLECWSLLSSPRQAVLVDMCYNMGSHVFSTFHSFLSYLDNEEWQLAHDDMLGTLWARQVKSRATEDAQIMLSGQLPPLPPLPATPSA